MLEEKHIKSLDKSGVKWFYEYKSFSYINSNGKRRTYTPDFYFFWNRNKDDKGDYLKCVEDGQ